MAGKARRNSEKEHRRKLKKARKETNRARYAALRDQGINSKSKRSTLRARRNRAGHNKHQHEIANCGNVGCKKCFPRPDKPHVVIQKEGKAFEKAIREGLVIRRGPSIGKLPFPLVRPKEG